ncbi:MAG: tetratricopeptide repeat protein [Cyanophyceae cyanobacterium]
MSKPAMRQPLRLFLSILPLSALALLSPLGGSLSAASGDTLYDRGVELLASGRHQEALVTLTQAIQSNPRFAAAYSSRCAAYLALGDGRSAAADCDEAILHNPALGEAYVNRGNLRIAAGDPRGAYSDAEQALLANPDLPGAYNLFGEVFLLQRNYRSALNDLNKALQLDPNFVKAYVNRANVQLNLDNENAAAQDFTQAVRRDPSVRVPLPLQNLVTSRILIIGEAYLDRGELQAALAEFELALRVNPNSAGAFSGRGLVFQEQGQIQAAIASFERALEFNPQNIVASEALEALRPPEPEAEPVASRSEGDLETEFLNSLGAELLALEASGVIPLTLEPARQVSMARQACFSLGEGQSDRSAITSLVASRHLGSSANLEDPGTGRTVGLVIDTGVNVLCPQFQNNI